jgi:hypothetical protein
MPCNKKHSITDGNGMEIANKFRQGFKLLLNYYSIFGFAVMTIYVL